MTRRSFGLDLARATAISFVLVWHFLSVGSVFFFERRLSRAEELIAAVGGFFGVELFFALSGFLIGRILLDAIDRSPTLDTWARFVVRRWLRTLPLYFLWLVVLLVFLPPPHGMRWHYVWRYLSFTQNFDAPMLPGGWGGWFGHSWSLSVEEWFYLLFSGLAFSLAVFLRRRAILIACGIFIVVALLFRHHAATALTNLAYVDDAIRKVMIVRLDAIAYGVLAAWMTKRFPSVTNFPAVLLSASAFVIYAHYHIPFSLSTGVTLMLAFALPAMGLSLALPALSIWQEGPRIVSPIVRWLSSRSYALYLFHFSFLEIAFRMMKELGFSPWLGLTAAAIMALVLADLSFRYFESPILRHRPAQFRPLEEPAIGTAEPAKP
jgi:peptidoglycan/LPS O-acetylase OafA/YrhL